MLARTPRAAAEKQDEARRRMYNLRAVEIKENFPRRRCGGSEFYNAVKRNRPAQSFFLHDFYNIRRPIVHNKSLRRFRSFGFKVSSFELKTRRFLTRNPKLDTGDRFAGPFTKSTCINEGVRT